MAESRPTVHLLESIMTSIVEGRDKKFCAMCLRSETERKLVTNEALQQLTDAMSLSKTWKNNMICEVCNKKAASTFKFLKAASYAANVEAILKEIHRKKKNKKVLQEESNEPVTPKPLEEEESERDLWYAKRLSELSITKLPSIDVTGEKSHAEATRCAICDKQFKTRQCLRQHNKHKHQSSAAENSCAAPLSRKSTSPRN